MWRASARLCLWFPASHAGWIGGPALALAYAVFSGWGVPAQRTVVMLAVVCLLRLSSRSWPWPMVWLLAGVAVLLIDPWALLQRKPVLAVDFERAKRRIELQRCGQGHATHRDAVTRPEQHHTAYLFARLTQTRIGIGCDRTGVYVAGMRDDQGLGPYR